MPLAKRDSTRPSAARPAADFRDWRRRFRARLPGGSGVAAGGFDGVATCVGSSTFDSADVSVWELSVGGGQAKADEANQPCRPVNHMNDEETGGSDCGETRRERPRNPTRRLDGLHRAPEAARRLGITTKELLRLVHTRRLRHVVVEGVVHVSDSALLEYERRDSRIVKLRHGPPLGVACVEVRQIVHD